MSRFNGLDDHYRARHSVNDDGFSQNEAHWDYDRTRGHHFHPGRRMERDFYTDEGRNRGWDSLGTTKEEAGFGSDWRDEHDYGRNSGGETYAHDRDSIPDEERRNRFGDSRRRPSAARMQWRSDVRDAYYSRGSNSDWGDDEDDRYRSFRFDDGRRNERQDRGFFGKGPKNWRRSDERIKEEASEALYRAPRVDASNIELDVKDGCVYLRGEVDTRQTKREAESCIENLTGVSDVRNELRVKVQDDVRDLRERSNNSANLS